MNLQMRTARLCLIAAAWLLWVSANAMGQDYKIKLNRPLKAGARYNTSVTAAIKDDVERTLAGSAIPEKHIEDYSIEFQGVVTVVEVKPKDPIPTRLSCIVSRFTKDGKVLYPAGAVITQQLGNGHAVYDVDGKEVQEADEVLFENVLESGNYFRQATSDGAAGSNQSHKPGDTWLVNADLVSKVMGDGHFNVAPSDISGQCKLVKAKRLNGQAVVVVNVHEEASKFKTQIPTLGENKEGKLFIEETVTLPAGQSKPVLCRTRKLHIEMTVDIPNGAGTERVTSDHEMTVTNDPIE